MHSDVASSIKRLIYGKCFHSLLLPCTFVHRSYKSTMRLNMTIMSSKDYGEYNCVSKNELGMTRGQFHVLGA